MTDFAISFVTGTIREFPTAESLGQFLEQHTLLMPESEEVQDIMKGVEFRHLEMDTTTQTSHETFIAIRSFLLQEDA